MKTSITLLSFCFLIFLAGIFPKTIAASVQGTTPLSLTYFPGKIIQGEPLMAQMNGITGTSSIKSVTFDGKTVGVFMYQNKPSILVGIDLNKKPGGYKLIAELSDGRTLKRNVVVSPRPKVKAPLGIPAKLGGNSTTSDALMVTTLNAENKTLADIPTASGALWTEKFTAPLSKIFITDPYGYSRQTGVYSIPHKGVDYRAASGTDVMAVNDGIVRLAVAYRDYGNTIVIDHGLGLMSFYLHLSKMDVKAGDTIKRGQVIGLSGQTGYAEGPHLHLSVRIDGISIDPVKFLALFR